MNQSHIEYDTTPQKNIKKKKKHKTRIDDVIQSPLPKKTKIHKKQKKEKRKKEKEKKSSITQGQIYYIR